MAFTTIASVRELTNLTTADVSDADITALIAKATVKVNSDVNNKVTREIVVAIDNTRENDINGVNTTYYVRNWRGKFLADRDKDGTVDTSDLIVYQVASDGTETKPTISSITVDEGKFVMNTAPASGVQLYVSYDWCSEDESIPSNLIELATANLTAAYSFQKRDRGLAPQQVHGNIRLFRDMRASSEFYKEYQKLIDRINSGDLVDYTESMETF